jgi:quercetin dioxygenase-like cupin family protein
MAEPYTYIGNLVEMILDIPVDGIISRTVHNDDRINVTVFGFAAGQELTEHTASKPAVLHFLQGQARLTLGADTLDAKAGTWVHMPAHLPHSVHAQTPTIMLLLLLKGEA